MANRAFQTVCNQCGDSIKMVEISPSTWEPYDVSGKHYCNSSGAFTWSLWRLGHPLTCTIDCWWCGQKVYYHTNGNGDSVLFDYLGKPWPVHPCWIENKSQQLEKINELERTLARHNYDGKDELFSLLGKTNPYIGIKLTGNDHHILDKFTSALCTLFNKNGITYMGPTPLRSKRTSDKELFVRIFKLRQRPFEAVVPLIQNFDVPISIQIEFKNI